MLTEGRILIINIRNDNHYQNINFDLILDVQGAELKVLKGLGKYIKNVDKITTEVSKKEYYKGGVIFDELNEFIINNGFKLIDSYISNHGDVVYLRDK